MKRVAWILLTPLLVLTLLWALLDFVIFPRAAEWAKAEIERRSADPSFPVEVHVGEIRLRLFRPSAEATRVEIIPRGELAKAIEPVRIRSLRLRLDIFEVLIGHAEISALVLNGIDGRVHLDPLLESHGPARPLPIRQIFDWSERIPLKRLLLENARVELESEKNKARIGLRARSLIALNRPQHLRLDAVIPEVILQAPGLESLSVGLATSVELNPKTLEIQEMRLRRDDLVLRAQGTIDDVAQLPIKPRLRLKAQADVPFATLAREVKAIRPTLKLPEAAGSLQMTTDVKLEGSTLFESAVRAKTQGVRLGKFVIGDASLEGQLTSQALRIDHVVVRHPAGEAEFTGSTLEFAPPYAFKTEARTKALDLQALFQSINLHQIPLELKLAADLPCTGQLQPIQLTCTGRMTSDHVLVRTKNVPTAKTVVSVRDLETQGEAFLNAEGVRFQNTLRVGHSQGQVDGQVSFENGFSIDYKTPSLAFSDVEDLASLKMEGSAAIEGSTQGNADTAGFQMKIAARDFVFEHYTLGDVNGHMRLEKGHLIFPDLVMGLGKTAGAGNLDLDLVHDRIGGEFRSDQLDAADVVTIFSRVWKFPFDVQAGGKAQMDFDGPLDFWKLNYHLRADLRSGKLQGDTFDSLTLKASANEGNMVVERAELRKNQSLARVAGGISSAQQMDLLVDLTAFRLEESEWVGRVRSGLAGQLNLTSEIKGTTSQPDVRVKGSLGDIIAEEQDVPSSFFNFHVTREAVEGETNLLGNRIQADVRWPFGTAPSPLRLRVKTTDWAFTSLLSLMGATSLQNEYDSNLTADIDLHADSGRIEDLSGQLGIRRLMLRRGGLSLQNQTPMTASFDKGRITLRDFALSGPLDSSLTVRGEGFRFGKLNLGINANTDLRLLQIFTPFLEDLGGPLQLETSVGGSVSRPLILGNATVKNGFVRLKGFPHPIERVQTDIVFSHSRILIQDLMGQVAGGNFAGEGSVAFNDAGEIATDVRVHADGLNLNVPDKVHTSGSADLVFSGTGLPFVLSGTYNVSSAFIEKEIGDDAAGAAGAPHASNYLPKILRRAQIDPVILDLRINLLKTATIRNSLVDGSLGGNLQVKGPPQSPVLLGTINLERGTKIIVKDKVFETTIGTINFNNPETINPELYISAQSRVNEYDVTIIIQGPAKSYTIRMNSVPALSEQELVTLLALGISPQKQDKQLGDQNQSAKQASYEALGLGLSKTGLQKGLSDKLGLNVQVTTGYDSTRNISVPKFTITRQLSNRLSAAYLKSMDADAGSQEVQLRYQLNANYSAVGSYEDRAAQEASIQRDAVLKKASILGLDLEFKREFK